MKQIIAITILSILVNVLCLWDLIYTNKVFSHMKKESSAIYETLLTTPVTDQDVAIQILDLKNYWTKHMDALAVSISRKDLQPISDQLQFLHASITNDDQESAITYSLLLKYNVEGLTEVVSLSIVNIL